MTINVDIGSALHQLNLNARAVDNIKREAADYFHDITPIRSGNARRNTRLSGDEIVANYPYAQRLDNGWSKQAPMGMTKPTEKKIQELVDREVNRINKI